MTVQRFLALLPPPDVSAALRTVGVHHVVGPHITVKAQPALGGEPTAAWLPRLRRDLVGFGRVQVRLGRMAAFGTSVAYLEISSDRIRELHNTIMSSVKPSEGEAAEYFESDDWTPHLTLQQGDPIDFDGLRMAVARVQPLPSFAVDEVWVCRQAGQGSPYVLGESIDLT